MSKRQIVVSKALAQVIARELPEVMRRFLAGGRPLFAEPRRGLGTKNWLIRFRWPVVVERRDPGFGEFGSLEVTGSPLIFRNEDGGFSITPMPDPLDGAPPLRPLRSTGDRRPPA